MKKSFSCLGLSSNTWEKVTSVAMSWISLGFNELRFNLQLLIMSQKAGMNLAFDTC